LPPTPLMRPVTGTVPLPVAGSPLVRRVTPAKHTTAFVSGIPLDLKDSIVEQLLMVGSSGGRTRVQRTLTLPRAGGVGCPVGRAGGDLEAGQGPGRRAQRCALRLCVPRAWARAMLLTPCRRPQRRLWLL
jgi:hypothetical protein